MYDWLHSIVTSALDKVSGHLLAPVAPTKGSNVLPKRVNVSVLRTGQDPFGKETKILFLPTMEQHITGCSARGQTESSRVL